MNFSESFKQSNQLCQFSPDASYLANSTQFRLIIRDVKTLQIKALFTCLDNINYLEWSCDSAYILCGLFKRGFIQVWSLENTDWTCKIDHGSMGLVAVRWAPDGRHILSTSDFKLRITVWSLVNKSVCYIKYPKHATKGVEFTKDGKFMAVAERRNCKDFISVFSCDSWDMLKHFETDTKDLADFAFSPNGCMIAVWDTKLEYKVVIYSLDGRFISSYSAYDFALGVKSCAWSPSNQFLAIGSYDQQVRILNNITWKVVSDFKHPPKLTNTNVLIYEESGKKPVILPWENQNNYKQFSVPSQYILQDVPYQVPTIRPDPEKPNPKLGVGTVTFSTDNKYMATKNDCMPNAVWIWDMIKMKLTSIVVQANPVRSFHWDYSETRLGIVTGTNKLYMWSPAGCLSVQVPEEGDFHITQFLWHQSSDAILLMSKDHMCLCYLQNNEN